jgi:hypothetical protein
MSAWTSPWAAVFDILRDWHTPRGTATWLNRRNGNLAGIRPRELIDEGRADIVIDEAVRVARG